MTKRCQTCGAEKAATEFHVGRGSCIACRAPGKARYNLSPEGKRSSWQAGLKAKYGLTVEAFAWACHAQGFGCAICREPLDFAKLTHVDHDHRTGAVRAILCAHCNRGLGAFRDSTEFLAAAIQYLKNKTP